MTDLILVFSCPKRPQYLDATLTGLEREGGADCPKLLCFDGIPKTANQRWPYVVTAQKPSGGRPALWRALEAAHAWGHWDRLLLCEDDIRVSRDGIAKMRALEVSDRWAFIATYDRRETVGEGPGLHERPCMGVDGRGLWGCQCLLIPRRTIDFVLSRPIGEWEREAPPKWVKGKHAGDCFLDFICSRSPWPRRAFRLPSLVDHAGDRSNITSAASKRRAWWFADHPRPSPAGI